MKKDRNCGMGGPMPMGGPMSMGGPMPMGGPGYQTMNPNMAPIMQGSNNMQEQINNMQGQINMLDKRVTHLENAMMSPKDGYNTGYNNSNYHVM